MQCCPLCQRENQNFVELMFMLMTHGECETTNPLLCSNFSLVQRLREYFGEHITNAHLKMAEAPAGITVVRYKVNDLSFPEGATACFKFLHVV